MLENHLDASGNVPGPATKPSFCDVAVVALALTAEYLSIDSENLLFKKIKADYADAFPTLHSRPQFNRRKRALFPLLEKLRKALVSPFLEGEDAFLTDSKPLPICALARAAQATICQQVDYARPDYGYKLYSLHTVEGVTRIWTYSRPMCMTFTFSLRSKGNSRTACSSLTKATCPKSGKSNSKKTINSCSIPPNQRTNA